VLLRVDVTKEFVTCETVLQFTTGDEMIFVHRSPKRCKIDGEEEEVEEEEQKFTTTASERARERAGGPREKKMQQKMQQGYEAHTLRLLGFLASSSSSPI
jgi:hypothetical protein